MSNQLLLEALKESGFEKLRPIQEAVKKEPLSVGKSYVISAATGSGKTLSYLLPILDAFLGGHDGLCLIVCPSKDLAFQINDVIKSLGAHLGNRFKTASIVGGTFDEKLKRVFSRDTRFVVITPGKLLQLLKESNFFARVKYLVMEEYDKVFKYSHESKAILTAWYGKRLYKAAVTVYVSASECIEFLESWLGGIRVDVHLARISCGQGTEFPITDMIYQTLVDDKLATAAWLVSKHRASKVVLFCDSNHHASAVYECLKFLAFPVSMVTASQKTARRYKKLSNTNSVIVSTDILSRGIDFDLAEVIISFSFPTDTETFLHRRGRTGRNCKGLNICLFSPEDSKAVLQRIQKQFQCRLDIPAIDEIESFKKLLDSMPAPEKRERFSKTMKEFMKEHMDE
jgi:superfamily II DNA/RNA helicase